MTSPPQVCHPATPFDRDAPQRVMPARSQASDVRNQQTVTVVTPAWPRRGAQSRAPDTRPVSCVSGVVATTFHSRSVVHRARRLTRGGSHHVPALAAQEWCTSAADLRWKNSQVSNTFACFQYFCLKHDSSPGQKLALTALARNNRRRLQHHCGIASSVE